MLHGAPRIYEKHHRDQWVREVDFTPSFLIGQSSALCLELPLEGQLPKFHGDFVSYKENEGPFVLKRGSTLFCSSSLVPIVNPSQGFDLPHKILFKINSLIQHGHLPGQAIDVNFYELVDPKRKPILYIESALDELSHLKDCCYEPERWLTEQYKKYARQIPTPVAISLSDGLALVPRVQITPSKVYFCGPEVNLSNRVLRHYPEDIDNFLRVSFVDEDLDKLHSTVLSPSASSANGERWTSIYDRILSTLRNGIVIGADIREWMGDFHQIRNVAKYAARLGLSFGSSRETLSVSRHEVEDILDVEVISDGIPYCFSDGIGKISAELAQEVATKCGFKNYVPSAFQIRYGGYKGVVAVDPTSSIKLSLRKSMCKYKSKNIKLDVLAWSKYQPCFLNRQIITLISYLGVKDRVFEERQTETIDQLNAMLTDPLSAQEALEWMFPGGEQHKDVRVLKAVNVPALHHMVDCVVFPQKGKRPHPNECSGSDLDGDMYFVCWDPDLIPPKEIPSMEYIGAQPMPLDHDVSIECMYVILVHDNFGIIDNAHTAFADKERLGAMSPKCIELAKLHAIAVDYPKSGVAAEIPHHLRVKVYPDFMEKSDKPTYESKRVIGKLFRGVKEIASHTSPVNTLTPDVAKQSYDPDMEVDGFKDYISDAFKYKSEYDYKLRNLMDYYGVETEAEILSGNILKTSKLFDRRRDLEAINYAVMALRKEARTWFNKGSESDSDTDIVYAKASACYHVTYHYSYWGRYNEGRDRAHFLSFPWCVFDKLIQIKKEKVSNRTV
uniref:RNA-dependent RNA polymerase n=1 Tax=Fagus sylvatica TaxID=28930 RepID=A0A2N9GXJ8_FAGSY